MQPPPNSHAPNRRWDTAPWARRLTVLVLILCCGCAGIRRRQQTKDELIEARHLSQRGLDAIHDGRYGEAEEHFSEAIDRCPGDVKSRYQLANCLWKRGDRKQAISQLQAAIRANEQDDAEMLVELGYMYANVDNLTGALQIAEQAVRVKPDAASVWQLHGDTLSAMGRRRDALASFQRALAYEPDNSRILLASAEAYHFLNRPGRVLATLNHVEHLIPAEQASEEAVILKAIALQRLDRNQEAVELLSRRNRLRPLSGDGLIQLAECQLSVGQAAEAAQTAQKAAKRVTRPVQQERLQRLNSRLARSDEKWRHR